MTKTTDPKSFPGAVGDIFAAVGPADMAAETGRSERTQYQWADPETPTVPDLRQALALDLLYNKHTDKTPPILGAYTYLFAQRNKSPSATADNVTGAALDMATAVGQFASALRQAVDPKGPGGQALTKNERHELLRCLNEAREFMEDAEDAVRAAAPKDETHV